MRVFHPVPRRRSLRRFRTEVQGNISITFALALIPLTIAVGAAVDYSRANSAQAKLQAAIDAAVLAAATGADQTDSQRIERGKAYFAAAFTLPSAPAPAIVIDGGGITGTATYSVPNAIMGIIGQNATVVKASAVAQLGSSPGPCILLLEPSQIALTINSDSRLTAGCGVHVNSSNREAIYVNSYSKIVATSVCVKGNYRLNSASTSTPTPKTGCPVKPDPLASLPEPSSSSCNFTDMVVQGGQTKTLSPGTYCKKLEIQNNATVNLQPGVYIFPDSELIVQNGAKLIGDNVMLFFKDAHGYLNANSGGRVQLKAPATGTYKGIVMFQSRASSSASAPPHIVNSDSSSYFQGTIYVPNGKIMLNSQSTLNQAATYTAVIARTMELNSYGTFVANANFSGSTPLPNSFTIDSGATTARLVR